MVKGKKKAKKNPRGTKKKTADKIHGLKKGKKGEAAQYITRAQALTKLQVSLADFRKLCILKGVYPRDPKKKAQGMDKTYYHKKDIQYLAHEPLLQKFYELHTFLKKFKRLVGRGERGLARGLEARKPKYTLHHLVRERYPSFEDAVRDLDDALSMLALFGSLSGNQTRGIPTDAIGEAIHLYQEFQLYVIRAQALRKVFASIKGYYFQAEIAGQTVTWLAPHSFAQHLPHEVDFRVMLTFLEFYRTAVKFVNFRLYSELGLAYPPKRLSSLDQESAEVAALELDMHDAARARETQLQQSERADTEVATGAVADFGQSEEANELQRQLEVSSRMKSTFRGLRVYVNREVPLRPIYFTLLCGGVGEVGWERGASEPGGSGPGSAFPATSDRVTHHIVDRPPDQVPFREGREFVQPQWVLDSFNLGCLLPIAPYAPGRTPPPHLSPFVDDRAEGYVPRQREILDRLAAEAGAGEQSAGQAEAETPAQDATSSTAAVPPAFQQFSSELRAETAGVWHSAYQRGAGAEQGHPGTREQEQEPEAPVGAEQTAAAPGASDGPQPVPRPTEEEEERLRAKALMPKKHKRLLQKIESSQKRKTDAAADLARKRQRLEAAAST